MEVWKGRNLMTVILLITIGLTAEVFSEQIDHLRKGENDPIKSAAQAYFDAVAPADRVNFIKYYLDKALEDRIPNHVSKTPPDFTFGHYQEPVMATPMNFSTNLLDHFQARYGLTDVDVYNYVTYSLVCFTPPGVCIDPDDVGSICCPF
ncbi:uncharacterized protein LOC129767793 isoform X1 [Toxorhynchites rutilus septentrionalis]|uniref:uncharacterized protein LOC129767793 isoform X1 n=1 Tax=Toxorhynchites rutilus septentrionalis TaxID=329112 RepID=UPI00247A5784|nr:uncharacterized protein LOC129767793 isoform X1 [Toxorhynchites rutilus septentrionalis]XP_055624964.1 uncharacterized protein LOC129767793 isoform X1 [Toxorhynchites rutilus septentrionalis]XP_055624965.1 uncharacterized protein LOC129767793 isoform X1 [Toxorhynchites rutilus septentrionalis]